MSAPSLQSLCLNFVSYHAKVFGSKLSQLPYPLRNQIVWLLHPLDLRRLEVELQTPREANQDIWLKHYATHFAIYYRGIFKATQPNEINFCAVSKTVGDYRRRFLEDHFHVLLEDASKITTLLHRGVLEFNVMVGSTSEPDNGHEKACCHVKLKQIKDDMLLCAPFVNSLKIYRSKVLMSPFLKDVLNVLTKSVLCIRLVFLHDYHILKETIEYFMNFGNIIDFHTTWQPQRCSMPAKRAVEVLTLLSGLQLPKVSSGEEIDEAQEDLTTWTPYDLYDYAITGARLDLSSGDDIFACASVQSDKALTHISLSSFMLTQYAEVHDFIANTLLFRWTSLQSLKLSNFSYTDIEIFSNAIIYLAEHHSLRQICFEDTKFTNPMNLLISLIRVLIRKKDIILKKLTILGVGQPFVGNFSSEIAQVESFDGIQNLDLSFSSLNNSKAIPTFCEYLKRDKALRSLNLNCCKLITGEPTSRLLRAIGESTITELVLDFNPINTESMENALVYLLHTNLNLESLSCILCSFNQTFLRNDFLPAIGDLPKLSKLYLAENRIGDLLELKDLIIKLLRTRSCLSYLDLSSNFLSGSFLLEMANSVAALGHREYFFKGLNLSFNIERNEAVITKNLVREEFDKLCPNLFCMILHEDPAEPARLEHVAQM